MRLFRQPQEGAWEPVVLEVMGALEQLSEPLSERVERVA